MPMSMKIYGINKEEINVLKDIFKEYQKNYSMLTGNVVINKWTWSKSFYFNLEPLEIEVSGYKKGVLLDKEPKVKSNVIQYGFNNDEIVRLLVYGQKFLLSDRIRIIKDNTTILLNFGDSYDISNLNRVCIIYFDDINKNPLYLLSMDIDENEAIFVKETYTYNNSLLSTICRKGFISEDSEIETIIDCDFFVNYENNKIKEILCKSNNLKEGSNKLARVYPK